MIKRYGLGAKPEKLTDESVQFGLMGIVERPDGEYYRASDVDPLLESIGAGGVNGRITSKTLDEHRAEFEAEQEYGLERCDEGYYINIDTLNNWGLWKAARGICEPGTRDCDPD